MLLRRIRHVLPLLCVVCRLSTAFPTQTPSAYDDVQSLQVTIPHSGPLFAPLGSSISIPCSVSLPATSTSYSSSSAPVVPRVKWTVVSGGVEKQILVARGDRVKISEAYRGRASLLDYESFTGDPSLWLEDLRSSDSGHYRCEAQFGLEDTSDLVQLKVKGVVFHYRDALGRYAFSFHQAQRACEAIGAEIATPNQLLAAYYDGYEQCDAGWLADQSVRYPIQVPREGCYGDMDGQPGVRNYGSMNPDDLFDVYCYVEQIHGEVFHDSVPQQLSFAEAQSYCRAAGAELATTAQLYLAWSEGLDYCSPGWLSDGSVRYPIITPRERCGGSQAGVKTIYRFSNQTGFPEPSNLHDVYCVRGNRNAPTDSPLVYMATESEDIGQDVVILTRTDQELHLNQHKEEVEREALSIVESFPFVSRLSTEENLVDIDPTAISDTTASPLNTTYADLLQSFDEMSSATEMTSHSQLPLVNSTSSGTETYSVPQNTSLLPSAHNDTALRQSFNFTVDHFEPENNTGFPELSHEPPTQNQTAPDTNSEEQMSERTKDSQEVQETYLDLIRPQANDSEVDRNITQEERMLEGTPETFDHIPQPHLEEAAVARPGQMFLSTQAPRGEGELLTNKASTSLWPPLDGSGDISQERDLDIGAVTSIPTSDSSTSGSTTHPSPSASPSSTPAEPQTALPNPTSSSASPNTDKLGFSVLSTVAQLWESISKQEGSTSLESEEAVTIESEEKPLHPTRAQEILVSGASLTTTESSERPETSPMPTDSTTAEHRTSGYKVYWDTQTITYEEASGQEPAAVTAVMVEDITFAPTVKWGIETFSNVEDEANDSLTVTPTPTNVSSTTEDEAKHSFSIGQEDEVSPTVEEDVTGTPVHEDEVEVAPTFEEEVSFSLEVTPTPTTPTHEEETDVAPTLGEEAYIAHTHKELNVGPTIDETNVAPTVIGEAIIAQTLEEDNVDPTIDETDVAPTLEGEANVSSQLEEDIDEEANLAPTVEDFTVLPLDSQTSNWAMLTTTTGPQESLNGLEYSRRTSPTTSTEAPDSSSSTNPTKTTRATTTPTVKTTTHWSRRTWSPTTTTQRVFHKTTEPQKVTHLIPPVDQGLVDGEFSLTQPPTLLILPNERAAVGGTGKSSDACEDDPCLNGGTCTDRDGQIKCLCLPTYGGNFCQTDLERCEPGWDKFHGFCYRHFGQRLSWEVAEKHCRMLGAHLVSIMTPEEQSYINSNYKEYQWTGLNDKTIEDDFHWSDGNPLLYENWYRGQPDSYFLSGEDCVVMVWHDDGRWSDVPCNYHLSYTCKKGTTSCGPPPKVRNTSIFGKVRQRYETNAVVRYHCVGGFQQRLSPVIRCLSGGLWERPQIMCIPEGGGPTQDPEAISPTNSNVEAMEDDFESTKETPQYWDIKF